MGSSQPGSVQSNKIYLPVQLNRLYLVWIIHTQPNCTSASCGLTGVYVQDYFLASLNYAFNVRNVSEKLHSRHLQYQIWFVDIDCIDKLRRSMPNLIRAPSMPSVPSIPCLASPVNPSSQGPSSLPTISSLRSSQSFDSSNGLARLQSSSKTLFLKSINKSAILRLICIHEWM